MDPASYKLFCEGRSSLYYFRGMYDEVHIDEKWFLLTRDGVRYMLVEDEVPPERDTKHKRHTTKVMFLCAQARPRKINGATWDRKIGMWPVGQ